VSTTQLIGYVGIGLLCLGSTLIIWIMGSSKTSEPAALGLRGWKRQNELAQSEMFRMMDPAIRLVVSWIAPLPLTSLRAKAERQLALAGDFRGLDPDSWFAWILIYAAVGGVFGVAVTGMAGMPPMVAVVIGILGGYSQYSAVDKAIEQRQKSIKRTLPGAIDLMSLCVSAGLTFPQAVRHIVETALDDSDPCIEEMRLILRQMDLGHTRAHALETFAVRVPIPAVRDFVGAVVQAEAKGTPLKDVLSTQAVILRDRRSTEAEEAAAKADVKLTGPLMIMMMMMLFLIAAPMIMKLRGNNNF
jgi:tight adherence protein C